jgi:hypothetical protein
LILSSLFQDLAALLKKFHDTPVCCGTPVEKPWHKEYDGIIGTRKMEDCDCLATKAIPVQKKQQHFPFFIVKDIPKKSLYKEHKFS